MLASDVFTTPEESRFFSSPELNEPHALMAVIDLLTERAGYRWNEESDGDGPCVRPLIERAYRRVQANVAAGRSADYGVALRAFELCPAPELDPEPPAPDAAQVVPLLRRTMIRNTLMALFLWAVLLGIVGSAAITGGFLLPLPR